MSMKFTVNYHDKIDKPEPIVIDSVTKGASVDRGSPGYYRLKIGFDLTIFISEERLRELGRVCLDAEPLPAKSEASA